jgi:hypothetical protein
VVRKRYGQNSERIGDPVGDHSHAATVRQLLRLYRLLDNGRLVSPAVAHCNNAACTSVSVSTLDTNGDVGGHASTPTSAMTPIESRNRFMSRKPPMPHRSACATAQVSACRGMGVRLITMSSQTSHAVGRAAFTIRSVERSHSTGDHR